MYGAYYAYTEWPGGIYATPSMAGSRCAAPIVGAWFSMRYIGLNGYQENSKKITDGISYLKKEINATKELEVVGDPQTCAICFTFKKHIPYNIYAIENAMKDKGWHLSST
jgi:sphinganine-1-phosphate aldolase